MREHVERLKAMLCASGLVAVAVQRFGEVYRATLHRPARIGTKHSRVGPLRGRS
jgi:hypothetical protein